MLFHYFFVHSHFHHHHTPSHRCAGCWVNVLCSVWVRWLATERFVFAVPVQTPQRSLWNFSGWYGSSRFLFLSLKWEMSEKARLTNTQYMITCSIWSKESESEWVNDNNPQSNSFFLLYQQVSLSPFFSFLCRFSFIHLYEQINK